MTILFLFSLMLGKARDNSSICSENKLPNSIPYTPKLSRAIMWEPMSTIVLDQNQSIVNFLRE